MQKINEYEIKSVLNLEPIKRYSYFIKRVVDFNEVWILSDDQGRWAEVYLDQYKLVSLWSAKEFAELLINGSWENFSVKKLSLKDFYYELKEKYGGEKYLINVFSKPDKTGFIVDLEEFKRDILIELDKYSM